MKYVLFYLFVIYSFTCFSQDYADHFFIYAKEKAGDKYNMEYGKYQLNSHGLDIKKTYENVDSIYHVSLESKKKGLIFYIHGFTADNRRNEMEMGQILHKEFYSQLSDQYDLIISLKWSPEKDYLTTITSASNKGKTLYQYINTIISNVRKNNQECPITFIMHSMGNRVFENITIAKDDAKVKWNLHQVLLIAPDLEDDVFFTTLKNLSSDCKQIYYFYNIDDRTLGVAKAMKPYERLGIVGHKDKKKLPQNIFSMDTTGTTDNEGMIAQMTLHRYWYASPTWREKVLNILKKKI